MEVRRGKGREFGVRERMGRVTEEGKGRGKEERERGGGRRERGREGRRYEREQGKRGNFMRPAEKMEGEEEGRKEDS